MNEIQLFQSKEFGEIKAITKGNDVFFIAREIAELLGYSDHKYAIRNYCKGVEKIQLPSNGGYQETNIIPEKDVYRLIIRSSKKEAEKFEEWIVSDVIPSIRKNGIYSVNDDAVILQAMEILKKRVDAIEAENKEMKPKALFYDDVSDMKQAITFQDFARAINYGRNKLFDFCRNNKILDNENKPYQKYINAGYFHLIEKYKTLNNEKIPYFQTVITGKGQTWLHKKIKPEMF